jgi:hypothetical protein
MVILMYVEKITCPLVVVDDDDILSIVLSSFLINWASTVTFWDISNPDI